MEKGSNCRECGRICKAEVHWYEAHGLGRKKMKIKRLLDKAMTIENPEQVFALCIENKDCEDLEKRKIYQVLPDDEEAREGYRKKEKRGRC